MNSYELSRQWFDWCFENPEKSKPIHSAIYFFSIEHCNRLGWKEKFGFPSQMVMEALGIKNWRTYSKALNDLHDFGFIKIIEISKNQYSSNIIAIVKNTKANTKALDKALQKHSTKQSQSIDSIDKQITNNKEQINIQFDTFWDLYDKKVGSKEKCQKKWVNLKAEERQKIIDTLPAFKSNIKDKQYQPHPETYLNQKRWNDILENIKNEKQNNTFVSHLKPEDLQY